LKPTHHLDPAKRHPPPSGSGARSSTKWRPHRTASDGRAVRDCAEVTDDLAATAMERERTGARGAVKRREASARRSAVMLGVGDGLAAAPFRGLAALRI